MDVANRKLRAGRWLVVAGLGLFLGLARDAAAACGTRAQSSQWVKPSTGSRGV